MYKSTTSPILQHQTRYVAYLCSCQKNRLSDEKAIKEDQQQTQESQGVELGCAVVSDYTMSSTEDLYLALKSAASRAAI